jgi:outer membrane lipoprotein SlyB
MSLFPFDATEANVMNSNSERWLSVKRIVTALTTASVLAGCAVAPVAREDYSLIDPRGVDMGRYQQDYADCAGLANQTRPEDRAAAGAVGGAALGAAFGALLGAVICGRDCAGYGAGMGAASGLAHGVVGGAASGVDEQQMVLRRCLAGRGYNVIR